MLFDRFYTIIMLLFAAKAGGTPDQTKTIRYIRNQYNIQLTHHNNESNDQSVKKKT